jgi:hypothetical protein
MKTRSIVIGLVVGIGVLSLIYFIATYDSGPKYQWYQSFKHDSDQPYGTMFIEKMLASSYKGSSTINSKESISKVLGESKYDKNNTDYILVGQSIHLDDDDVVALKNFMDRGNNVFIATVEPPSILIDEVYENPCETSLIYDYNLDSLVTANFYHSAFHKLEGYEFRYRVGPDDYPYFWRSLDPGVLCDSTVGFASLGYQGEDHVNFLRIPYGSGNLYLHTSPIMFTNYFLIKPDKYEYAQSVFSHLNCENMIWDEVSKVPFQDLQNPYESPLYYIMQQPALKYAWWMFIVGAVLYIIFASKRTQRIIPVLEPKTNTSLEFLSVISSLHYQNPNHFDMARKKMKYFLYFIRAKYGINTQTFTEEHAKRLAERAKVDFADTQAIHDRYKVIENYSISNEEPERLVGLYQAIDKFYKTCK